ncbi:acetyl-CoA carboxylase, biotin carboxylase subunit [Thermoflexales bacterium]|nr:acetyl-CoA carboxylase, biotin carboxylase subunit [Thermoflexales bacterium]
MFKKILIANRGEIAVRIIRTCRDMGISSVALYEADDRGSLHVRLADECVLLESTQGYFDTTAILKIAQDTGAKAIHPGYGFLAENIEFIRACQQAGLVFIGPPLEVMLAQHNKIEVLQRVTAAGWPTVQYSADTFEASEGEAVRAAADRLGYPVMIKSTHGGRGRGAYAAQLAGQVERMLRRAQTEAQLVYGNTRFYVEKQITPAHMIGVQVLADAQGQIVHLGEREGSLIRGNQKMMEEAPAPGLTPAQRADLWRTAVEIVRLIGFRGVGTIEFMGDLEGHFYFTEIKPRIQIEHTVTEMISTVDLVREQICLAAGEALSFTQAEVQLRGHAISCRITAQDPWRHYMPSPGVLRRVRLPTGHGVRVDTYAYSGCAVPAQYDPIVAKVIAWGDDRAESMHRLQRALSEIALIGVATTLPIQQLIAHHPEFLRAAYHTESLRRDLPEDALPPEHARDLAIAAAIVYARRNLAGQPSVPDRLQSGWHRSSRRLRE